MPRLNMALRATPVYADSAQPLRRDAARSPARDMKHCWTLRRLLNFNVNTPCTRRHLKGDSDRGEDHHDGTTWTTALR